MPFHEELDALLAETDYVTSRGRPNLAAFSERLDGVSYEVLRRAARGSTKPSLRLLEEVARALELRPDYFLEYRIAHAAANLDLRSADRAKLIRALGRLESLNRKPEKQSALYSEDEFTQVPPFPPQIQTQLAVLVTELELEQRREGGRHEENPLKGVEDSGVRRRQRPERP